MAQIISGKEVALKVRENIKAEVNALFEKTGKRPGLAVIIVGEDPASQVYVRNKAKGCEEVGFHSEVYRLAENTQMDELLALIEKCTISTLLFMNVVCTHTCNCIWSITMHIN